MQSLEEYEKEQLAQKKSKQEEFTQEELELIEHINTIHLYGNPYMKTYDGKQIISDMIEDKERFKTDPDYSYKHLREDRKFALYAIKQDPNNLQAIGSSLQENREFAEDAVKLNPKNIEFFWRSFWWSHSFMLSTITKENIKYALESGYRMEFIATIFLKRDPETYRYLKEYIRPEDMPKVQKILNGHNPHGQKFTGHNPEYQNRDGELTQLTKKKEERNIIPSSTNLDHLNKLRHFNINHNSKYAKATQSNKARHAGGMENYRKQKEEEHSKMPKHFQSLPQEMQKNPSNFSNFFNHSSPDTRNKARMQQGEESLKESLSLDMIKPSVPNVQLSDPHNQQTNNTTNKNNKKCCPKVGCSIF